MPAASVTVTVTYPGLTAEEITVPLFAARSPVAPVTGAVVTACGGTSDVSYHVARVPFKVSVCVDDAAKPVPVMTTVSPALNAAGVRTSLGVTVNVADAAAPLAVIRVTVWVPATALVTGRAKPLVPV